MKNQRQKAITLIALIITIIILLILAGVTIITLTGENGLLARARAAKNTNSNATIEENVALESYEESMGQYVQNSDRATGGIQESSIITKATLNITAVTDVKFIATVDTETTNNNYILDYHIYFKKVDTGEVVAYAQNTNQINVTDLEINTKYIVYAAVCDKDGNFRKTANSEITTLDGPPLTILTANAMHYNGGTSATVEEVTNVLFDGNTNNGGRWKGLMFVPYADSYLEIQVNKQIKINAYGHYYSDGGGPSGANLVFDKFDGTNYQTYKTVPTDYSGNKYELITLEKGKYKVHMEGTGYIGYVNFDEWEIE